MRRLVAISAVLGFLILLSGCSAPPKKLAVEKLTGVNRIAVVSLLGEELEGKYVGWTAFNNKHWLSEPTDWGLNELSAGVVSRYVTGRGIAVLDMDYPRETMWERYLSSRESYKTRVSEAYGNDRTTPLFGTELRAMADEGQLDGFILLVPGYQGPMCPSGEPCIGYGTRGYGIQNHLKKSQAAYLSIKLYFVSASDLTAKAQTQANLHGSLSFVDWHPLLREYSETQREEMREAVQAIAEKEIPRALQKMGI
ncbi:MAG: hypothetical protein VX663_11530 [Pseudomonadota bacterium]|nr:hypothetical protein [Pseudomonadota bacterium]